MQQPPRKQGADVCTFLPMAMPQGVVKEVLFGSGHLPPHQPHPHHAAFFNTATLPRSAHRGPHSDAAAPPQALATAPSSAAAAASTRNHPSALTVATPFAQHLTQAAMLGPGGGLGGAAAMRNSRSARDLTAPAHPPPPGPDQGSAGGGAPAPPHPLQPQQPQQRHASQLLLAREILTGLRSPRDLSLLQQQAAAASHAPPRPPAAPPPAAALAAPPAPAQALLPQVQTRPSMASTGGRPSPVHTPAPAPPLPALPSLNSSGSGGRVVPPPAAAAEAAPLVADVPGAKAALAAAVAGQGQAQDAEQQQQQQQRVLTPPQSAPPAARQSPSPQGPPLAASADATPAVPLPGPFAAYTLQPPAAGLSGPSPNGHMGAAAYASKSAAVAAAAAARPDLRPLQLAASGMWNSSGGSTPRGSTLLSTAAAAPPFAGTGAAVAAPPAVALGPVAAVTPLAPPLNAVPFQTFNLVLDSQPDTPTAAAAAAGDAGPSATDAFGGVSSGLSRPSSTRADDWPFRDARAHQSHAQQLSQFQAYLAGASAPGAAVAAAPAPPPPDPAAAAHRAPPPPPPPADGAAAGLRYALLQQQHLNAAAAAAGPLGLSNAHAPAPYYADEHLPPGEALSSAPGSHGTANGAAAAPGGREHSQGGHGDAPAAPAEHSGGFSTLTTPALSHMGSLANDAALPFLALLESAGVSHDPALAAHAASRPSFSGGRPQSAAQQPPAAWPGAPPGQGSGGGGEPEGGQGGGASQQQQQRQQRVLTPNPLYSVSGRLSSAGAADP